MNGTQFASYNNCKLISVGLQFHIASRQLEIYSLLNEKCTNDKQYA